MGRFGLFNARTIPTLAYAARNGNEAIIRLLLEYGADVEAKGQIKCSALYYAVRYRHEAVVRLMEREADVNAKSEPGETALHLAAGDGRRQAGGVKGWRRW
jgi:ankyrin repeat protein